MSFERMEAKANEGEKVDKEAGESTPEEMENVRKMNDLFHALTEKWDIFRQGLRGKSGPFTKFSTGERLEIGDEAKKIFDAGKESYAELEKSREERITDLEDATARLEQLAQDNKIEL